MLSKEESGFGATSEENKQKILKQIRIERIKIWELEKFSFWEIVIKYNAEFGTHHFSEVL